MTTLYTVGHSNTPSTSLVEALSAEGIHLLVDIRRYPASRRNPQFNSGLLTTTLAEAGIGYLHMEALGGRRRPLADSPNTALTNEGFRGYADYTATEEFEAAVERLLTLAAEQPLAVMCAEAVPWSCHRSILADNLVARGHEVVHLIGKSRKPHVLNPLCRPTDGRVTYPALL